MKKCERLLISSRLHETMPFNKNLLAAEYNNKIMTPISVIDQGQLYAGDCCSSQFKLYKDITNLFMKTEQVKPELIQH